MNRPDIPIVKELVLIGGGHTHALVLRMLGMRPVPGVRLTLINPGPTAPYSGMLPGFVAGHYRRDDLDIDLVRLARFAGARLILGAADGIDPVAKTISVPGRPPIHYDLVSVDIGITSRMDALPGFAAHGVPAKPLGVFADRWSAFCDTDGPARITVIGGGIAGVEVALACAHRMQTLGRSADVILLDRSDILTQSSPSARKHLLGALAEAAITLRPNAPIARVDDGAIVVETGEAIEADFIIGAAGAVPHPWLATCGLDHQDGFLCVDDQLRSTSHPDVYGAGDCVHLTQSPRPKAGVYAVRAAPILAHNLRADLIGAQRKRFHPQRDFLKLVSLGGQKALAEKAGITLAGPAMWRWKDRIDQRFMDQFRSLPTMGPPPTPKGAARGVASTLAGPAPCGGCGAKLGARAIAPVFESGQQMRTDLDTSVGDDAAVLQIGGTHQVISTDHLRAFAEDPVLVTRAAALHALGDVWAMGAAPQIALAHIILPRLDTRLQSAWMAEIMATARATFAEHGAEIAGGHSSMGAELTIGFTVTGLLDRPALTLDGAQAGDDLILTRGLGSGTLLAAEMQGKAPGDKIATLWDLLGQPQAQAAKRLAQSAHAMTDVTGFGLAGHLLSLCRASELGAALHLPDIPLLPGAEALADQGLRATLWAENAAAASGAITDLNTARAALLHDPQTCGGFLAAVPPADTASVMADLRAQDSTATVIGRLRQGAPFITLTDA